MNADYFILVDSGVQNFNILNKLLFYQLKENILQFYL